MTASGEEPGLPDVLLARPQVVVLVGASGSGKTTLRRRLLAAGWSPELVVSLDDLRRAVRDDDVRGGRPPRLLQDYSLPAVRRAAVSAQAAVASGAGYLADATHLRRSERREHVIRAAAASLPAVAVLLPLVDLPELLRRNAARPGDERVPAEVLARQHHRWSLLTRELIGTEGFSAVL